MSQKPYPQYKESGVRWLGEIPSGWALLPLWSLFRRNKSLGTGSEELLSVYRDYGVIPKSSRNDNFNKESDDLSKYQLVGVGDLVINKMKAWQGSVAISGHNGIVSPAYFVFRSLTDMNLRFMHYLMRSTPYYQHYASISAGVRPNQWDLDPSRHRTMPVLFPPRGEQQEIADFLDIETAEIDAFIADQEELIALLEERRAATITRAITRGLDPQAPMKDSGVEWLGDVPQGWSVQRLSHVTSAVIDCLHSTPEKSDDGKFISIRTGCIRNGHLFPERGLTIDEHTFRERTAKGTPEVGDVFFTREAPAGEAALVDSRWQYALGQRMVLLKPANELLDPRFLVWNIYMPHVRRYVDIESNGSTVKNLPIPDIKSIPIVVPRKDQQQQIVAYLNREAAEIDAAISEAREAIMLSKERRAAMISAAVTGKIDVRGARRPTTTKVEAESVGVA